MTTHLLKYIRYYILTGSIIAALFIYVVGMNFGFSSTRALSEIAQSYALIAITLLYLALLCTPLYAAFPKLPFKAIYIKARRAIGVSAFIFAAFHGYIEFFKMLGGFSVLPYLQGSYLLAIIFGAIGLLILFVMTLTSTNYAVRKLGKYWKIIHRFAYLAAFILFLHALSLGSEFSKIPGEASAMIIILLAFFLLILESLRFGNYLNKKYPYVKAYIFKTVFITLSLLYFVYLLNN